MPELKAILEKVVLHKIDTENGEGIELAKTFKVEGHPTFVVLLASGDTVERWRGYGEAADFVETLGAALADPTPIEAKRTRFEAQPSLADAEKLANYHESRDEYVQAVLYFRSAQEYAADAGRDFRFEIFEAVASGCRKDQFTFDEMKKAADVVLASDKRTPKDVINVGRMTTSVGRSKGNHEIMVPYLKRAVAESEGSQDEWVQTRLKSLRVDHALFVEKDAAKAVALRRANQPEGWLEKAEELNAFAWWCFENRVNLEEAETLARKGVGLAENGKTKAELLDTVAELCNARGSCQDAVSNIELAIQADPQNEHYQKQLQRFRKLLAEM